MKAVTILFPHQLFEDISTLNKQYPVYLIEEFLFFNQYRFHKQKLLFHRMSMKQYANFLHDNGFNLEYINANDSLSDIRKLLPFLQEKDIQEIHFLEPYDNWLSKRINSSAKQLNLKLKLMKSSMFITSSELLNSYFSESKKKFLHNDFYIQQRKALQLMLTSENKPLGGKWSFDADNRKKYPKGKTPPKLPSLEADSYFEEAVEYVNKHYEVNPGSIAKSPLYPTSFQSSKRWLSDFLENRFREFGEFEDAIVGKENFLHHSVLSPLLNVGLLTPKYIIKETLQYGQKNDIPLNSLEGFLRQIIGWREFIAGLYSIRGSKERTTNFWGFKRPIPESFYNGTTGIVPVDDVMAKINETAYAHHIERLMVLGNFMLLCEFDPDEVYKWFMELFIDAYDWVMVPNVYGMSQFADGGIFSTKPYISSSNYILKMSNYKKCEWQNIWDALFWRFLDVNRSFFNKNIRMRMLINTFDKFPSEKKVSIHETADNYLLSLE
jgi:deoxyribodipyrimidine photolyase-related protein